MTTLKDQAASAIPATVAPTPKNTHKLYKRQPAGARDLIAPDDLKIPFWPLRRPLEALETYDSTSFWFTGMKPATKRAYAMHLRLFCRFYSTTPDILVKLTAEELKPLLDAYLVHLISVAVKKAGKPKPGQFSVNSVGQYFTGLRSFLVEEHEKEINWVRYENKFPDRIKSDLRSYQFEEVQKMYKNADIYDKPIVLLEYGRWVRVGAIGPLQFKDLMPIPEFPGFYFCMVYSDDPEETYPVVLSPEFMTDLNELRDYRQRVWGEKITPESYIICPKYSPHCKVRKIPKALQEDAFRKRMRRLAIKAGVDLSRIQPNHGMRKAGNTAAKNAHMDKDFKELLMGHSTGLDDTYYDIEIPQSRKELVMEYLKALPYLTVDDSNRLKEALAFKEQEVEGLRQENTNIKEVNAKYVEMLEWAKKSGFVQDSP